MDEKRQIRYFSMFSGIGGFELGIQRSCLENKGQSENTPFGNEERQHIKPVDDSPKGFACVGYSEIDKYAIQVYRKHFPTHKNYGDATKIDPTGLPDFDLLVGGFPCFIGDTLILTRQGYREIKDINIGDEVFTHKRRWKPVIEKHIRIAGIREISAQGIIETGTTNEHPYLARRRTRKWDNDRRCYTREFGKDEWIEAKELQDNFICQTYPEGDKIDGSSDFWWVVGRYIADGWLVNRRNRGDGSTCRVVICSGHHKAERTRERIERCFQFCTARERTAEKYHITNKAFSEFLKPVGRKAHNKQIPVEWFGMDKVQGRAFFDGYWSGDGCHSKSGYRATTTSRKLALGLAMLYQKVYGRVCTITHTIPSGTKEIEGRIVNQRPYWTVSFPDRNRVSITDGDFSYGRCRFSRETNREDLVYNIGVEEDESYIANNAVVHNCQAFSIAGKRRGFEDTRGTLFFEIARILEAKRPKTILLENVKGLLNHDKGETFKVIIQTLSELGYETEWMVLNSKFFGVPQNRERVFIIGSLGEGSRPEILPFGSNHKETDELQGQSTNTIKARHTADSNGSYVAEREQHPQEEEPRIADFRNDDGLRVRKNGLSPSLTSHGNSNGGIPVPFVIPKGLEPNLNYVGAIMSEKNKKWLDDGKENSRNFPQGQRVYSSEGISSTIAGNAGGLGVKTGLYMVRGRPRYENGKRVLKYYEYEDTCPTISQNCSSGDQKNIISNNMKIRRLTPIECERLQGFPDGWTSEGLDDNGSIVGISDTQRYKQCGNAVTVNVIEAIVRRLL